MVGLDVARVEDWQVIRETIRAQPQDVRRDYVAMILHWVVAIMTTCQFLLIVFPNTLRHSVAIHKTMGMTLGVVVVLAVVWRLMRGWSDGDQRIEPPWMRIVTKAAHCLIYALLIGIPLLGWAYCDAMMTSLEFYGLPVPVVVDYDRSLAITLLWWKTVLAYGMLALLFGHAIMAIVYHHVIRRDDVLRSMLPLRPRVAGTALGPTLSASDVVPANR